MGPFFEPTDSMRLSSTLVVAAAFGLMGAAHAQGVDSGLEVRVNPVPPRGGGVLLYPGGEYSRVMPSLLYPGEGKANLDMDRTAAIDYLNSNENGTSSLFTGVGNTSTAYDGRVRGMVGMLMSFPRFQEQ